RPPFDAHVRKRGRLGRAERGDLLRREQRDFFRLHLLRQANTFPRTETVEPGVDEQRRVGEHHQDKYDSHRSTADWARASTPSSTRLSTTSTGAVRCGAMSAAAPPERNALGAGPSASRRRRICSMAPHTACIAPEASASAVLIGKS